MTTLDTTASQTGGPQDSCWLSRAEDGDVLLIMYGASLVEGRPVEISLGVEGRLRVVQDGKVAADAPLDQLGKDQILAAPNLLVQELYRGATESENTFVIHEAVSLA